MSRHSLVSALLAALVLALPASAQTISSPNYELREGRLLAAAEPALVGPFSGIELRQPELGEVGTGTSIGPFTGLQLVGGIGASVVPEPSAVGQLGVGVLALAALSRRRRYHASIHTDPRASVDSGGRNDDIQ